MANGAISAHDVAAAVRLAAGRPDLVVVDRRVLRLLMGDLADLIILQDLDVSDASPGVPVGELEPFVWDKDSPCS